MRHSPPRSTGSREAREEPVPAFDLRKHRTALKLVRQERDQSLYSNQDGVCCPVCGRPFRRVLATHRRRLELTPDGRLCVLRGATRLFLFSH